MVPNRHTMIFSTTFQKGSSRPIPRKLPQPFGSRTITIQLICSGISPRSQMAWINSTKIHHLQLASGSAHSLPGFSLAAFSLCCISSSHSLRCLALIPVAPVACPFCAPLATIRISESVGMPSKILKCKKLCGRATPMGGALTYNFTCSAVYLTMVSGHAGGDWFSVNLYHPLRVRHTSFTAAQVAFDNG